MSPLFPAVHEASPRTALCLDGRTLSYADLAGAAAALAARLKGAGRVALWATPGLETCVGAVAALLAGVPAVPLNPRTGERELAHILADSAPATVLAAPGAELPGALAALPVTEIDADARATGALPPEPDAGSPALIVYTSGTTGPPKGVVIPRRAIVSTLDDLADAWHWTAEDVLVHALPLFHVHGLILGILGPLRRGGSVRHLGRFTPEGVARELADGGTMFFGVPTMYHRLAETVEREASRTGPLTGALAGARVLVSGSAALPRHDYERLLRATGQQVVERYGMTETLMNTSVRLERRPHRPGSVGEPLPGVELRLVDEADRPLPAAVAAVAAVAADAADAAVATSGEDAVGEIQVRGASLFTEYLNRPDATRAAFAEGGWFRTGDMATRDADGSVRIVGRKATDLIKSGGYKIGAGEIENALLEHPEVAEAAVTGEPDPDLGERVVAWIVPADAARPPGEETLAAHVAEQLAPHKRPRAVRILAELPRNDMGKVMKRALGA